MWEVWISCRYWNASQLYDSFPTREEANACRDEYNEYSDETYAYVVQDTGD